jgi:hypothetical protein
MKRNTTILLDSMKKIDELKSESVDFQEEIIENSKEYHVISDLLNQKMYQPSDQIIEKILQKCGICVSH